ncbi:MAG TPA: hypothetical protein VEL28_13135 [Candidatus Binatia bacterium]|nr:hypothetical protein [Candidatus Binatia bacterium]
MFLGSGVSLESGLPSVEALTSAVLTGDYYESTRGPTTFASDPSLLLDAASVADVQKLLCLLGVLDQRYLQSSAPYATAGGYRYTGAVYRSATTYEDLFYLASQIAGRGIGLADDSTTGAFMDVVEREAGKLLGGGCLEERLIALARMARRATSLIEHVVAKMLQSTAVKGLELIVELARSSHVGRLDVITLNHDILLEQALVRAGITYADGFGLPDGDVRWREDAVYDRPDTKVRIVKPHGSIDWFLFARNGGEQHAVVRNPSAVEHRSAHGELLKMNRSTASFLTGVNKVAAYNQGTFSEMHFRCSELFRRHDRMIMSGYGWADTGQSLRIDHWLDSDEIHSILLFHRRPLELRTRSLLVDQAYDYRVKSGQVVPVQKWLSEASLSDVTDWLRK